MYLNMCWFKQYEQLQLVDMLYFPVQLRYLLPYMHMA